MSALAIQSVAAQTRMEIMLTLRRGENLLVTLVIPVGLLIFFASTNIIPTSADGPLDFLVPGILALAIISTGMVNLGIATAYERHYSVLKRLGGSPLSRAGLLAAKTLSILFLELIQVALVLAVSIIGLGWQPRVLALPALLAIALGTLSFSGIGLAMAGGLRAEATLAIANGLYLLLLLLGDIVLPTSHLPPLLQPLSAVLPASALADLLRFAFGSAPAWPGFSVAVLLTWTVAAAGAAVAFFRWD
jgi:ABC-2 type transport system permease protein